MSRKAIGIVIAAVIAIAIVGGAFLMKTGMDIAFDPLGEFDAIEGHVVDYCDGEYVWDDGLDLQMPERLTVESVEGGVLIGKWGEYPISGTYRDGFMRFQCAYVSDGALAIDTVSGFSILGAMVISGVTEIEERGCISAFNQMLIKWGVEDIEVSSDEVGFGFIEPGDVVDMYGAIRYDGDVADVEDEATLTFKDYRNNMGVFRIDGAYDMTVLANADVTGLSDAIAITDDGAIMHAELMVWGDHVIVNLTEGPGAKSMLVFTEAEDMPSIEMPFECGDMFGNEVQTYEIGGYAGNLVQVIDSLGGTYVASVHCIADGVVLGFDMVFDVGGSAFYGICEGFVGGDKAIFSFVGVDDDGAIVPILTDMDRMQYEFIR